MMVSFKQDLADTGEQSLPTPNPPYTHIHTHRHTHRHTPQGSHFSPSPMGLWQVWERVWLHVRADWQDWHLSIATLIMGICLDAPVWGPSRVLGCCHRDGGEPLVVWGADRDPVILLRGGQTWPPTTHPFWFGWETVSSQPRKRQIISGSFCGLWVQILWDWQKWQGAKTVWVLVQEYCINVWVLVSVSWVQHVYVGT